MSIYFDEKGRAVGYKVEKQGNWLIKGDYLQLAQSSHLPGGLYKITDNKVKFPFEYTEVEGVINTDTLTFTVNGVDYKLIKPSGPFPIPVRFPV